MDTTLVGGAADDTYTATQATLTAGDQLNGGTGTDTLSITSTGGTLGDGVVSRLVENIRVTATGATTVNGAQFDDVVEVENTGSTAGSTVTFTNLKTIPVIDINATNSSTNVGVAASLVTGTSDAATVNLTSSASVGSVTVTVDGIETINVAAAGTSGAQDTNGDITGGRTVTVASNALTTLNVTGTGSARIVADLVRATETITGTVTSDAGGHNVEVIAGSGDKVNVSMGAGNDTVRISSIGLLTGSSTATGWTVAGGEGEDTLIMSAGSSTITGANISDFEAARVTTTSAVFVDASKNDIRTVTFDSTGNFTGLESGGTVNARVGGSITVANTDGTAATGWRATTATSDSLTVNSGTTSAGAASLTLTATGVETITINNLAAAGDTTSRSNTVSGSSVKTLTVSAPGDLTLTASSATALTSVDAGSVVGGVSFTSAATAGASVTGGAGNDTLGGGTGADTLVGGTGNDSLTGNAGADSLSGGDGADTITGGTGADTLTGGDGADRFVFASNATTATTPVATSTISAQDVITDFKSGTDKISITGTYAPVAFLGNFANIQAALAANNATGVLDKSAAFVTSENALYVFKTKSNTLDVDDMVIKLEGVTSLAAADLLLGSQGTGNFITIAAAGANIKASGSTGGTVTATKINSPDLSIDTTDRNDVVTVTTVSAVEATTSVAAGAGSDELVLAIDTVSGADGTADATDLANFTGFETITLSNRSNSATAGDVNWNITLAAANAASNSTLTVVSQEDGLQSDGTVGNVVISAAAFQSGGQRLSYTGGDAHDSVTGGNNNDTISGGNGNDIITGGTGNDSLSGGEGNDNFILGATASTVTSTITGGGGVADKITLLSAATATFDLTGITQSTIESIVTDDGGNSHAQTVVLDTGNMSGVTSITFDNGGTADKLHLAGGTYNFSTVTVTAGTAASILDLNAADNLAKTITVDAADLNNFGTITGESTADIVTTVNLNDTIDLKAYTISDVDVITIGGTEQTLTVDQDHFTSSNFTTVTGSGTSVLVIKDVAGNDGDVDLRNTTISGFTSITTDNGTDDLILDAASISGATTLLGDAGTDIVLSQSGNYSNITLTGGDFDSVATTSGTTITLGVGMFSGAVAAVDAAAAGTDTAITIAMGTATSLNLGEVAFGANNGVDTTIIGSAGNDTITLADAKAAGSSMTVTGNGGADNFRFEDGSGNAADGVVLANAVRITDFSAAEDSISVAMADTSVGGGVVAINSAGLDLDAHGFVFIQNASVNDFTSVTALSAAVGNMANAADGKKVFIAVKNTAGTQIALYHVTVDVATTEVTIDAGDTVTLVAVVDVTAGTFGLGNMGGI